MYLKALLTTTLLSASTLALAQTKPDPNVDVSVFELRVFSNETAIDGKPIVAKNGLLAVNTASEANCTDGVKYEATTFTQFLIGLTTYNPGGNAQTIYVGTNGQNLQVAAPGAAPAEEQVPTGFRQIVHWDDKLLQFRGAGFQACPRSNFDEWIVSVQPGALPTTPECNIFDAVIVPKEAATAPKCTYN
ncbi:General substrate transporter [Macrophomina phaseolina MS6]|uniref:General substrate transporter n=1 Tax=Macrophomina phaseolina (strain MS6) TaxID=1126212 RepID=K2RP14_MACPH|nr:General substrate transporter [Macrophomina phaseolina MS6]